MAAFDADIKNLFVRLHHLTELIAQYSSASEDSSLITLLGDIKTDLETQAAALQTQIDALQAYITANPGSAEDLDPIKAALDTNNTNFDTAISDLNDVITAYPTDKDLYDALTTVQTAYLAAINAGQTGFTARTVIHRRCDGNGWYLKNQDTGLAADANVKVLCVGCGAHGYIPTGETDNPVITYARPEEPPTEIDTAT